MNRKKAAKFERKILDTIKKHNLISRKDKVLVAASGGKDSSTILYVLKKFGYKVEAITINVAIGNYTKKNLQNLRKLCKEFKIKLHEISFRERFGSGLCHLHSLLKSKGFDYNYCTTCGVLRRYLVNKFCRKHKADKVVTGHNLDDEAQSVIMNFFRNTLDLSARLGPITGIIKDKKFVPRVKPLYFCSEKEVISYAKFMRFDVEFAPCPCRTDAFRNKVRIFLDNLEKKNPKIKENIVKGFLAMLPSLKKRYFTKEKINYCKTCGEPAKKEICNVCSILSRISR